MFGEVTLTAGEVAILLGYGDISIATCHPPLGGTRARWPRQCPDRHRVLLISGLSTTSIVRLAEPISVVRQQTLGDSALLGHPHWPVRSDITVAAPALIVSMAPAAALGLTIARRHGARGRTLAPHGAAVSQPALVVHATPATGVVDAFAFGFTAGLHLYS
jgi:hypothetical protein